MILRAPITEEEFRTYPVFQLPTDFSGDKYTRFMNQCWEWMEQICYQPLTATTQTHTYPISGRYANITPEGWLQIAPKHLPIVSVKTIRCRPAFQSDWQTLDRYEVLDDIIVVHNAPAGRGAVVELVYTSGYDPVPEDLRLLLALFASQKATAGTYDGTAGSSILPTWLPKEVVEGINRYKRVR